MKRRISLLIVPPVAVLACGDDTAQRSEASGTTGATSMQTGSTDTAPGSSSPSSGGASSVGATTGDTETTVGSSASSGSSGSSGSSEGSSGTSGDTNGTSGSVCLGSTSGDPNPENVQAIDDAYATPTATALIVASVDGVLSNDSGTSLTVNESDTVTAAGGTVAVGADGSFTYTPPAAPFFGGDSFTYGIDDGDSGIDTASVRISVAPTTAALSDVAAGVGGFAIDGENSGDKAGSEMAPAGDMNGDGLEDFVVGAHSGDGLLANSGTAYLIFGTTQTTNISLSAIAAGTGGFVVLGEKLGDSLGLAIAGNTDVNGDGLPDLVLGAPGANAPLSNSGRVAVVYGKTSTSPVSLADVAGGVGGFVSDGQKSADAVGSQVASGDINGDGLEDLVIGARYADPPIGFEAGKVFVVFGKLSNSHVQLSNIDAGTGGFVIRGEHAGDRSGRVDIIGDINGDGRKDILVGTTQPDDESGRAYVVYGKESTTTVELSSIANGVGGFMIRGHDPYAWSAYSVTRGGDINGDGIQDLLIGAYFADTPNGDYTGRGYVVFGSETPGAVELSDVAANVGGFVINGTLNDDETGSYACAVIRRAADFNGDGLDDIVSGGWNAERSGTDIQTGQGYLIFGKTSTTPVEVSDLALGVGGFVVDGENLNDWVGWTSNGIGDINGDGFADVAFGSYSFDPAGRAYVVLGGNVTGSVTHRGGSDDDVSIGTPGGDYMVAGAGDDTLHGGGGADVLYGGAGNDTIRISDSSFKRIHGGTGNDVLALAGSDFDLDLSEVSDLALVGIETIDLTGSGANSVTMTLRNLRAFSTVAYTLTIVGNCDDAATIDLSGGGFTDMGITDGFIHYSNGIRNVRVATQIDAEVTL